MYDFGTLVNREGMGSLKNSLLPDHIQEKGIISFSGAEMDFKTAPSLIDSVIKRSKNGLFGFTLLDENYLQAVKWWMKEVRNWEVEKEWVVPALGTIFSVATSIRLLTEEGDGVIIQPPVYNRYEQAVRRLNRKIVNNPLILENGRYKMDFVDLERCMDQEENKLFILCNPHNPIARVWDRDDLAQISRLAEKYEVVVFSDEIFAEITFNGHNTLPYTSITEKNAIVATSLGKTFNLTGVNHANMIIPNGELREAFKTQRDADHYGSIDPLAHAAVCGAYNKRGKHWLKEMLKYVAGNIEYLSGFISENLGSIKLIPVEGTFVVWLDMRKLGLIDQELQMFLQKEAYLCVDHGQEYGLGGSGFVRMNVANPKTELKKALQNLIRAMAKRNL